MELLDLFICILEDGVIALYLVAVGGCLLLRACSTGSEAWRLWLGTLSGVESVMFGIGIGHTVEGRCSLIRGILWPGRKLGLAAGECGGEGMVTCAEHSFGCAKAWGVSIAVLPRVVGAQLCVSLVQLCV